MHSKWKIWDFFKSHDHSLDSGDEGVHSFYAFDPLVSKLFIERIPRNILEGNKFSVQLNNYSGIKKNIDLFFNINKSHFFSIESNHTI